MPHTASNGEHMRLLGTNRPFYYSSRSPNPKTNETRRNLTVTGVDALITSLAFLLQELVRGDLQLLLRKLVDLKALDLWSNHSTH